MQIKKQYLLSCADNNLHTAVIIDYYLLQKMNLVCNSEESSTINKRKRLQPFFQKAIILKVLGSIDSIDGK